MRAYMYVCMSACRHVRMCVCMYACMYMYVYMYMYACMHKYIAMVRPFKILSYQLCLLQTTIRYETYPVIVNDKSLVASLIYARSKIRPKMGLVDSRYKF